MLISSVSRWRAEAPWSCSVNEGSAQWHNHLYPLTLSMCSVPAWLKGALSLHSSCASCGNSGHTRVGSCKISTYFQVCRHLRLHSVWTLKVLSLVPSKCLHKLLRERGNMLSHLFILWHDLRQQHPIFSPDIFTKVKAFLAARDQGMSAYWHLPWHLQFLVPLLAPWLGHLCYTVSLCPLLTQLHLVQVGTQVVSDWNWVQGRKDRVQQAKWGYVRHGLSHFSKHWGYSCAKHDQLYLRSLTKVFGLFY